MKVLIIGGTGLISTTITRQMLEQGIDLTLYNRGKSEARTPDGARQLRGDRNDLAAFERQMAEAGNFDCVIDMICFEAEQAESAVRAFRGRVEQFILCSTVDVYSKPAHRYPILENEPRRGNNDYGRNKIKCEDVLMAAHERGDFATTIIRPAYSYGEGGQVVDTWGWGTTYIDRLRKSKPIIVHGDGSSFWVACHVDDVGHTFVAAAGNPNTFGKAYHVTGEEWMTWDRYYGDMARAIDAPEPSLVHIPTDLLARLAPERALWCETNFQGNNILDNSAAKADLDFRYTIPWIQGARRTIRWLDEHDGIANSDEDLFDDRLIALWRKATDAMKLELADLGGASLP